MNLQLKRPIIFFDLETTGVDTSKDRIVEISMVKVGVDGTKQVKTRRINPEMPIPAEATAVHGITDDDVRDEPTFRQIAKSLAQFIEGCDFGGFNSNRFDLPVLVEEFMRAGVEVDFKRRKFAGPGAQYASGGGCPGTGFGGPGDRCHSGHHPP